MATGPGIDGAVLMLLRGGAIPLLCGSATCCLAIYSAKAASAARQWYRLELPEFAAHAAKLEEHVGACITLTLTSAAATAEAMADHHTIRSAAPDKIGTLLASRWPFFARPIVLVTAAASVLASVSLTGGIRLLAPHHPPVFLRPHADGNGSGAFTTAQTQPAREAQHQRPEAPTVVAETAVDVAQASNARVRWPHSASPSPAHGGPSGYDLMCDALAKRLAACESSNTPKMRFHCDPQRERWSAACSPRASEVL